MLPSRDSLRIVFLALLVAASPSRISAQHTIHDPEPQLPNVLLIVLDDVGVEKLQLYDALFANHTIYNPPVQAPPTPELLAISTGGVRFTHAYANPLCSPTRACLMTGRYPFRMGMGFGPTGNSLPLSETTIAEVLKHGFPGYVQQYKCGAFGKWHLADEADVLSRTHPIRQGFDKFVGTLGNVEDRKSV